jgi:hypothetical protein
MLYSWWWYSAGIASDVFRWLIILFFAQAIRLFGNILVRHNFLFRNNSFDIASAPNVSPESLLEYLWAFRNFPELVALLFMLALILGRLWCNVPIHDCLYDD